MESRPNEIGGLSHRGNYLPLVLPLVLAASSAAASAIIDTLSSQHYCIAVSPTIEIQGLHALLLPASLARLGLLQLSR